MKKTKKILAYAFYLVLLIGVGVVTFMGYNQVMAVRLEASVDMTTWLSQQQIKQLMRFHGSDVLKVTQDEVFISRDNKWVSVMRRDNG